MRNFVAGLVCCGVMSFADAQAPLVDLLESATERRNQRKALESTFRLDRNGLLFERTYESDCVAFESYLVFSPDSQTLAMCAGDRELFLVNAQNGAVRKRIKMPPAISDIKFSPDGKLVATAGRDVELWDIQQEIVVHTLVGHNNRVFWLQFSADGQFLATVDFEMLNLWGVKGRWRHIAEVPFKQTRGRRSADRPVAFTNRGQLVYNAGAYIFVLEAATGKVQGERDLHRDGARDLVVTLSPDGLLAAAAAGPSIRLFDLVLATSRPRILTAPHQLWITAQTFSSDSTLLLTTGADMKLVVWDGELGKALGTLMVGTAPDGEPSQIAISPDNKRVAIRYTSKAVRVWDYKKAGLPE